MNEDSEINKFEGDELSFRDLPGMPGRSLAQQLRALYLEFLAEMPANERQTLIGFLETLASSEVTAEAKGVGDIAPEFCLMDSAGAEVRLAEELKRGPVVLSFFRGGWCQFCLLELEALQRAFPEMRRLGASLYGISPERPASPSPPHRVLHLDYPVLVDSGNEVARAFGLTFRLPVPMRELYGKWGYDLPSLNGEESWELPVPATYLIVPDGRIATAFVDKDHTRRMEPSEIIFVLENLYRERTKTGRTYDR